jgi:hypothetical protein
LFEETLAPLADNLRGGVQALGDLLVLQPFGRVEDDLGPDDVNI